MNDKSISRPTVAILGGGYGGVAAAKALDDVADVLLVEPKDTFEHSVGALRAVVKPAWASRLLIPYDRLLRRGRIVRDRAVRVAPGAISLRSGGHLAPDYIVLATGSTYPFPAKNGVDDRDEAERSYAAVHAEVARADRVLLLGAGPVGLELAGEIVSEWPKKQVTIVDPVTDILGGYSEPLRREIRAQLDALGVRLLVGSPLVHEPPTPPGALGAFTVRTQAGAEVTADLWFRCYGARPVTDYLAGDLARARDPRGFVRVTPELRVEGQRHVFAIGDITSIQEPKRAKAAGLHAGVVAANIEAMASGREPTAVYTPGPSAIALPLGPNGGATEAPGLGVVGAARTAEIKGADLNVARFRALLGYREP